MSLDWRYWLVGMVALMWAANAGAYFYAPQKAEGYRRALTDADVSVATYVRAERLNAVIQALSITGAACCWWPLFGSARLTEITRLALGVAALAFMASGFALARVGPLKDDLAAWRRVRAVRIAHNRAPLKVI